MSTPGYDRLAGCYRLLETLAFGRALERARFRHFEQLRDCQRILLLGDGDGRGLALACKLAPAARIDFVDSSAGMIARAARRLSPADQARVTWRREDALLATYSPAAYDGVATLFFLDCFSAEQVEGIIRRIRSGLTPAARWLYADFALPARGWARMRARLWLALMHGFFRWQTGLAVRALPPAETLLLAAGFDRVAETSWQGGFLRSSVFRPGQTSGEKTACPR